MPNEFSAWFDAWLDANPERTHEKVAAAIGVSNAAISQWRNGRYIPEAQYIVKLAELTGESHFYLAHLAYGWSLDVPTDPMLREPLLREITLLIKQLQERGPDLLPAVLEVARGLARLARKRERGKDN